MAAVPVTIVGMLTDETGTRSATLIGVASLTGLGVGGGPIIPDSPVGSPPHPSHPIVERPEHPIVLPPEPPEYPDPPTEGVKPPPPEGGWGYHPDYGWGYFPGPGQAGPKKK